MGTTLPSPSVVMTISDRKTDRGTGECSAEMTNDSPVLRDDTALCQSVRLVAQSGRTWLT